MSKTQRRDETTGRSGEPPAATVREETPQTREWIGPRWAVIGLFLIALFGALYMAKSFVLPLIIALLFTLVFSPIVRFMRRRLKIWEPVSALLVVIGSATILLSGFYMLSGPIAEIVGNAPRYISAVDREMQTLQQRFAQLQLAGEEASGQSSSESGLGGNDDSPERVVIEEPGLLANATTQAPQILASILFALVFLFFLLSSGDMIYQKVVHVMPTLSDKKRAVSIAHDIERELSRYLLTITTINAGLGVLVGTALWWVEMPNAPVFGALAFLFNFIPYIGALFGIAITGVIALAEFGSLTQALVPVLLYLAATTLEGQFVTPLVVGRRLEMNAAAVFLSVAFWGWIWGVAGMFLAVPLMVVVKVFSSHVPKFEPFGSFLTAGEVVRPPAERS